MTRSRSSRVVLIKRTGRRRHDPRNKVTDSRNLDQVETFIQRLNRTNFRFAVGSAEAGHSATWTAFGTGSEYYIGARHAMGSSKISLHQSGTCRVALTEKHFNALPGNGLTQPPDRALVKWKRAPTPDIGAAHVASIIFPIEFLKLPEPQGTQKKPLIIFGAASPDKAVEIGFFYSREAPTTLEPKLLQIGHPIVCTTLDNGEMITVVAKEADCDRAVLPSQETLDRSPMNILSKDVQAIEDQQKNLTGMFWNNPGDAGSLMMIEVGGLSLRRNQS
jgi:hypothetical protein